MKRQMQSTKEIEAWAELLATQGKDGLRAVAIMRQWLMCSDHGPLGWKLVEERAAYMLEFNQKDLGKLWPDNYPPKFQ